MKKITCLLFLTLLFLSSCSSDTTTSAPQDDVLVNEVWSDSDTDPIHFIYDGKKIVSASHPYEDRYYTYTGDLITKIQTFGNGNGLPYGLRTEDIFTYDTNGRLIEHIFKFTPDAINIIDVITTTFVYNSANTVSTTKMHEYTDVGITRLEETRIIHLSGTRIASEDISLYDAGGNLGYSYTINYNYDTKNNPFKNVIGYNQIFLAEECVFSFDQLRHLHNIISTQEINGSNAITVTYTYNDLDFPLTAAESYVSEPGLPPTMTHYLYY
ncbi:hypothetical protein [Flavobacterium wongokense]|uniref:hypothetical protein n=1 Tax=Flavobacterium wongokense TaxID=2910674 RepID=UPI001F435CEF|nr:hypothetical protein [Flavobacterium sp. WG47]MCF6132972.1 hypothetical protein [Flavobacterium sp. WG47]